jgi:hypothetical protein
MNHAAEVFEGLAALCKSASRKLEIAVCEQCAN